MLQLNVNGENHELENVEDGTPLLWVLRDELKLVGTKFGCGIAQCGACTVHLNGAPVRSCAFPASGAVGQKITTIEGLAGAGGLHRLQQAWLDHDVPQCGYCQAGQLMAAAALIARTPHPSDAQIDEAMSNICRCGTYLRIRKAIRAATSAAEHVS
jgi:isoquinoline 1-oxidoreductase alpha subunit